MRCVFLFCCWFAAGCFLFILVSFSFFAFVFFCSLLLFVYFFCFLFSVSFPCLVSSPFLTRLVFSIPGPRSAITHARPYRLTNITNDDINLKRTPVLAMASRISDEGKCTKKEVFNTLCVEMIGHNMLKLY